MKSEFKKIDQLPAERVKEIMKENLTEKGKPLKAVDLHRMTGISEKHISNIMTLNKPLTEGTANKIVEAFPDRGYRKAWLLGYDDHKTDGDKFRQEFTEFKKDMDETADNQKKLLKAAAVIMALYGVEWDGTHEMKKYRKDLTIANCPAGSYQGENFYSWELEDIALKLYEVVGMELKHAAQVKRDFRNDMEFFKVAEKNT